MNDEVKTPEKKTPITNFMKNIPEPKRMLSLIIGGVFFGLIIKFWPLIIVSIFGDYSQKSPTDVSPVIFGLFAGIAILTLLLMSVWSIKGIWWPFLWASWRNSEVLISLTKNKRLGFTTPSNVTWDYTEVNKDGILDRDPSAQYISPNKVPCSIFIPEHAKTIDPRALLLDKEKDFSMSITTVKNVGMLHRLAGIESMRNPISSILSSGLLWLIMAGGILFLVMWPYFTQQMDNSGKVTALQNTVLECNQELVSHGITPKSIQPPTTTTIPNALLAQPNSGVKTNPNNI